MPDQNQQVNPNQNVSPQNESDELFWWSDDIFENSDLLQPINSEIDSAHQVIKSQNDLNNFGWEIKNNNEINDNHLDTNDLFEDNNKVDLDDFSANDNIFESVPETSQNNDLQTPPEIVDIKPEEPQTINNQNINEEIVGETNNIIAEVNSHDNENWYNLDGLKDLDDIDSEKWNENIWNWWFGNVLKNSTESGQIQYTTNELPEITNTEPIESIVVQDYEKYDPERFFTDVQKKFGELQRKTEKIHELVWKDPSIWFDLLWWNDDRQKITYKILSWADYVEIEKNELNKLDESNNTNTLKFILNWNSLSTTVNGVDLFDEVKDLQSDPSKKMQVIEKMNKFMFLLDEEHKKIQKYQKEKEEKNMAKWVFRNF